MFSQMLKLVSRYDFERLVKVTGAEKRSKGFSSWGHLVAMLFCQLGRAHSLREIEGGLKSCEGKLAHLGIEAPRRSTLAYANEHRPAKLFEQLFHTLSATLAAKVRGQARRKFRFKNKLVSLDSTLIELCLSMFDWARYTRTKGAVKLHLVLDHDGYLPSFGVITEGAVADVKIAHQIAFAPGTIVVDDRGYDDYVLFGNWTAHGVYFVTRMKSNACYEVVEQHAPPQHRGILADETIRFTQPRAQNRCPHLLRRIEARREGSEETLVFLTNHHGLGASTIAAIYKDRWQIELFFKALKQNLKIKTFVGTTANAVQIQIWTALIAMLLLRYLQFLSRFGWSLSNLVALLRMNLFTHRDLRAWLNQPFEPPPDPTAHPQVPLALG
ncbi:MAG TPA: IS4 family transposase [Rhodanobacteraceae bacterium]|jgi:hypothetical protein|nr:IS4 family transposase [Rhodanobacteraceae bacterium]